MLPPDGSCSWPRQTLAGPRVPYEWLVLGSQARYEHELGSDQDHVLLLDDDVLPEHDPYFAALAESVAAGLERCGYPRCPGEVMATNPRWRRSLQSWRAEFRGWIAEPGAAAVLHAQIFFDFRSVHGGAVRAENLRDAFGIIRRMQQALGYSYQTHLMS